jgi:HlyD family secretion protein
MVKGIRRALLAALVLGAAVITVLALRPQPVSVDVARATLGPLTVEVEESGMTRVKDRYHVSAPVSGHVSRLNLEPGDIVREGDVLAEIAPAASPLLDERTRAEAEARLGAALSALDQAKAQAERAAGAKAFADRELARTEQLAQTGALAPQALEQAQFAATSRAAEAASSLFATKVAQEEVRIARVALGRNAGRQPSDRHLDVLSPISGRVLRVHQKSAGVVPAGAPLVEVGDPGALEVVVDLLTTDAVRVSPGTPVKVDGWGGDRALSGRVRRIEPSAFTRPSALGVDEQRVNVLIVPTDSPEVWASLCDGYRVQTHLVLWHGEKVLRVPHGSVFRHGAGWAVFRVDDGFARLTPVTLGHRGETEVEVTFGLSASSRVAVHPGDRVKDGVRVDAR